MHRISHRKPDRALLITVANRSAETVLVVSILLLGIFALSAAVGLQRVERAEQIAARV